jgi:hypothetical protein
VPAVGHRLDDAQEALPGAVLEGAADKLRRIAVEVLTVGPEKDHDLGRRCPAHACPGRAEAVDQPCPAQPTGHLEAVGLDPDQEPHVGGQRTTLDDVHHGDIRVEEHRAGITAYGVDDVVLDRALRLGVGGPPCRLEHLDERVAVVGSDD